MWRALVVAVAACGRIDFDPLGVDGEPDAACIRRLFAGHESTCVMRVDHSVWCWGANAYGELALPSASAPQPVQIPAPADTIDLSGRCLHMCALGESGTATCWGNDANGQLGVAGTAGPVAIALDGVVEVETSTYHTTARIGGTGYAFGDDTYGELGDGTAASTLTPVMVAIPEPITYVSPTGQFVCARTAGAGVYCWGTNTVGQLGDGTTTTRATPAPAMIDHVAQLAAGSQTGTQSHVCVRRESGEVACWGDNSAGSLGDGTTTSSPVPVDVVGIPDAVSVVGTHGYTCAIRADESLWCWGANERGQLGNGTLTATATPTRVPLEHVVKVATGQFHTCAADRTGAVYCWGDNDGGQLGDGTTVSSPTPIAAPAVCGL